MSGLEKPLKTSGPEVKQYPLKGFTVPFGKSPNGHAMTIQGMGGNRYRINVLKPRPEQK